MAEIHTLIEEALEARKFSYTPYSHFAVGAALLGKNGVIYRGCNVENAGYTATNCAERTAFFRAVSEGVTQFEAIAIVGAPWTQEPAQYGYAYPCGVCRQVMEEFCDPATFRIIVAKSPAEYQSFTLEQLLPCGFGPGNLK